MSEEQLLETWDCESDAELNQFRFFMDAFTLKWKSNNVLLWGRGYAFVSTGNERI